MLNFTNGSYDLKTGLFSDQVLIGVNTGYKYEQNIDNTSSKELDDFLVKIFPNVDTRTDVLNILSDCVYALNNRNFIPVLYGTGYNGKTTFIRLVEHTFGEYFSNYSFNNMEYYGDKKIVLVDGENFDDKIGELKKIVGGDYLFCKKENGIEHYKPSFVPFLTVNNTNFITNSDDGFKRRVKMIPCISTFSNYIDNEKHVYIVDHYVGSKFESWRMPLMKKLLDIHKLNKDLLF